MTRLGEAIARRESAIESAQAAFNADIEACGYVPGDSVAPLNAARDKRDAAIGKAWQAFTDEKRSIFQ